MDKSDKVNDFSDEVMKIAKIDLREDKDTKEQALSSFRQWIEKNPDLQNVNTDANFLLRFLRVKKYSLPMAQEMLLKYLNLRQTFRNYFYDLDFLLPSLNELISNGYMFPSPNRDKQGRRVVFEFTENIDSRTHSNIDLAKIHILTYETLLCDEMTQIAGVVHFGNCSGITPSMITYFTPREFYTLFKWGEQSLPMRHKEIHLVNVPKPLKYVYEFFHSSFSKKMKERFIVHNTIEDARQYLEQNVLPKEYGGNISIADMINTWKLELAQKRNELLDLDRMTLLNNDCLKKRNKQILNKVASSTDGSFRRLEVD